MTIVAVWAGAELWRREQAGQLPQGVAPVLEYGVLASAPEPFDPMEKVFHALAQKGLAANRQPRDGRVLKWEYGLRPELLAVTDV